MDINYTFPSVGSIVASQPSVSSILYSGSSFPYQFIISYFLIGGGGGSGSGIVGGNGSAGGGGGGVQSGTIGVLRYADSVYISVGTGGNGGVYNSVTGVDYAGSVGGQTSITRKIASFTIYAYGGSGGGSDNYPELDANMMPYPYNPVPYPQFIGSGGGAGTDGIYVGSAGVPTSGQGHNGGDAVAMFNAGGGGGGAGSAGTSTTSDGIGGNGGNGLASSITGASVYYGAGGSGVSGNEPYENGLNGLGYGNYGSGANAQYGGSVSGYSGAVILSIPTASYSGIYTGTLESGFPKVVGSNTILCFIGNGTYTA